MSTILTRLSAEMIRKYEVEGFWRSDTIYSRCATGSAA